MDGRRARRVAGRRACRAQRPRRRAV